jgi:2Fe-2S ferredoxin
VGSISVTARNGETRELSADVGFSLMEIIRNHGIDELLAICGGCCSCSTCHIYVESSDLARLPEIGPDEDDLLETSACRTERSRLSCQVSFDPSLDGLAITIAPED